MTLAAGSRLGPYEILAPLGAGGMGEVYRARDSRLGRDVAIKVLPQHLSANPDLRARFEREARTVSSLNHPHICTLHDIGREGETDYLVMELVEGGTLAERLAKGPLPADEALRIGIQIADALDRAHRAGIVHRDLKPGNIMLARTGAKLMDFGLARATAMESAPGSLTQSPTMTRQLTAEGAIVGTFQYMAPEQLDGSEADARSDIWALGATLYEMVTGQKAFSGRSQASLIASILKESPLPLAQAQPLAPPALDQVIRACLAKDPEQRIQTAHDVKLQLQWIAEGGSQAGVPAPVAARRRSREATAWAIAAAAVAAVVALGALMLLRRPEPARVMRFEVTAPLGTTAPNWPRLSPDGRMLAFLAGDSTGTPSIWVRPIDALEAHPLSGTQGAQRPFWSPDSRFLAYFIGGKLHKVPVAGGPPVTLAEAASGSDGSWGAGDLILFDAGLTDSIFGVPASGGQPRPITRIDHKAGETNHGWPYFLPDGKHFLFVGYVGNQQTGTIKLGAVGSNDVRTLGTTDGRVEYAPQGFIVFPREGTLMAQRLDAGAGKAVGDAVPVGENLSMGAGNGEFSVSPAGLLAYVSGSARALTQLRWFDRNGRAVGDAGPPGEYRDVALSPDGSRIAVTIFDGAKQKDDLWVRQIARGVTSRLTFDEGDVLNPVWSPDGERVAYSCNHTQIFRTFIRLASGVGDADSLVSLGSDPSGPTSWSNDGRTMAVRLRDATNNWDVWQVPLQAGAKPLRFVATPAADSWGEFSPDGRWIAYASTQSGRAEVFVQAANGAGGKWQVSTAGGTKPWWRADGRELFYQTIDLGLVAAPVTAGASFEVGTPVPLFQLSLANGRYDGRRWVPSADGQKILVNTPMQGPERTRFTVVTNWATELKRK
jgi:Tol biopolymer transport system component